MFGNLYLDMFPKLMYPVLMFGGITKLQGAGSACERLARGRTSGSRANKHQFANLHAFYLPLSACSLAAFPSAGFG